MTVSRLVIFVCACFFVNAGFAQSGEDWLRKINDANRQYQFNGTLTYEYSGYLQTAKVEHRVVDNIAQQKLSIIDGAAPSVIRRQALYDCSTGQTRWGLWPSTVDMDALRLGYRISVQGRERLAGRDTAIVVLEPVDRFRYGYRFNIDEATGLMIMRMRLLKNPKTQQNQIVDRTRYIDFALVENASLDDEGSAPLRVPEASPCMTDQFKSLWRLDWLPSGFQSVGNRVTELGEEVLMYSDGLASISVFITKPQPKNVRFSSGATSVTMASLKKGKNAHSVIVMGEVPVEAAAKIAKSVVAKK